MSSVSTSAPFQKMRTCRAAGPDRDRPRPDLLRLGSFRAGVAHERRRVAARLLRGSRSTEVKPPVRRDGGRDAPAHRALFAVVVAARRVTGSIRSSSGVEGRSKPALPSLSNGPRRRASAPRTRAPTRQRAASRSPRRRCAYAPSSAAQARTGGGSFMSLATSWRSTFDGRGGPLDPIPRHAPERRVGRCSRSRGVTSTGRKGELSGSYSAAPCGGGRRGG